MEIVATEVLELTHGLTTAGVPGPANWVVAPAQSVVLPVITPPEANEAVPVKSNVNGLVVAVKLSIRTKICSPVLTFNVETQESPKAPSERSVAPFPIPVVTVPAAQEHLTGGVFGGQGTAAPAGKTQTAKS